MTELGGLAGWRWPYALASGAPAPGQGRLMPLAGHSGAKCAGQQSGVMRGVFCGRGSDSCAIYVVLRPHFWLTNRVFWEIL